MVGVTHLVEEVVQVGMRARVGTVEVAPCKGDIVPIGKPSQGRGPLHDGVEVRPRGETVHNVISRGIKCHLGVFPILVAVVVVPVVLSLSWEEQRRGKSQTT